MNQTASDELLKEAMAKLETALLTPNISGELRDWVQIAQEATRELGVRLKENVEHVLHPAYSEISKADPELLPRVEKLIAEDNALLNEFSQFVKDLDNLQQHVAIAKRDEVNAEEHRQRIETQGTGLVLRIKKQQTAAATWLAEAFYRDRGPVD